MVLWKCEFLIVVVTFTVLMEVTILARPRVLKDSMIASRIKAVITHSTYRLQVLLNFRVRIENFWVTLIILKFSKIIYILILIKVC